MSCLHLITSRQLSEDFTVLSQEDEVVLLAEGSYLVGSHELKLNASIDIYVLHDDLQMRGLSELADNFKRIRHEELVQLVLKHEKSITW